MRRLYIYVVVGVLIAVAGAVTYAVHKSHQPKSDTYLNSSGCARSRSGEIHPDYCVQSIPQ